MPDLEHVLVVAATARELAPPVGWRTLRCGVGPVEAAVATAADIARRAPAAIVHVGIAGARRRRAIPPATLVIGTESRYCDLGVPDDWAPRRIVPPAPLLAAVRKALPPALALPIGTSGWVGGSGGCGDPAGAAVPCDVEAMEGFGVLRAAAYAGVPAIEVRAIANDIEEADRGRWHFEAAFAAITAATPLLVDAVAAAVAAAPRGGGDRDGA
jgi:nucleoside phosphorylase